MKIELQNAEKEEASRQKRVRLLQEHINSLEKDLLEAPDPTTFVEDNEKIQKLEEIEKSILLWKNKWKLLVDKIYRKISIDFMHCKITLYINEYLNLYSWRLIFC